MASHLACAADLTPEQSEFFEAKVRPVLAKHCYECHSSEGKKVKGGLLLDTRAGWEKGGDSGAAIVPGDPEKSLLIQAVRHAEDDLKMPKQKMAEHEIAALAEWVKMGAPDPRDGAVALTPRHAYDWEKERQHWAYRAISEPAAPTVKDAAWPRGEIDRFILAKMESKGLQPVSDADPRTLIRRMTYDLTGLPPTPEEVEAFVRECSSSSSSSPSSSFSETTAESEGDEDGDEDEEDESAVTRLVDRLLASPQYGERWGRHWMDLVRYADTAGDNSDYPVPQLWRYRNYVIDAFNADKPYDQFLREQIAGDLLPARDQAQRNEQTVATGYVALSRRFGSVVDRYPQHLTIEDTLDNMGKTFLGLSLSCARCHDHKFDAISQRDYTALYGIFASTRYAFPGIELLKVQKDFVPLLAPDEMEKALGEWLVKERELRKKQEELAAEAKPMVEKLKGLKERIAAASDDERGKLEEELNTARDQYRKVRKRLDESAKPMEEHAKARPPVPDAYAVQEGLPMDAPIYLKGEPERTGEIVPRRWLEVFGGQGLPPASADKTSGRRELADWIADPKNPLTVRVLVNRVWHYHFGSGLVKTPNDFGIRGQAPTHPELLDWLANRFIAEGWSIKKLHKQILLSRTYQLSSADDAQSLAVDPANDLHWRFTRRRLDAESVRDTLLTLSGKLDPTPLAEAHPFPPSAKWEFTQHHPFRATYPSNRRSVYLMGARLTATPFFQSFDGPDRNVSTPARDSSVTTVQALYFMNDEFVHEQAKGFTARFAEGATDDAAQLDRAFRLALQRPPSDDERSRLAGYLSAARQKLAATGEPAEKQERLARESFARALFRTNEFLYLD